jgi:8-oxo-dGTP diphosphatase
MPLYLVRHAKAGSRAQWRGDDEERPLSKTGRSQANRLAKWFAKEEVSGVLSSPYARCVQTVEPLAERHARSVEPVAELSEGAPFEKVIELLDDLPDNAVLCTHGDVMLDTIGGLVLAGMEVKGRPDFRKAAFWVLEREDGRWRTGRALPPR